MNMELLNGCMGNGDFKKKCGRIGQTLPFSENNIKAKRTVKTKQNGLPFPSRPQILKHVEELLKSS